MTHARQLLPVAWLLATACVLAPRLASAQAADEEPPAEGAPDPQPAATTPTWYSDPFAGMLVGFEAPAGVGLGLVFSGLDENEVYASATYGDSYTTAVDGPAERSASLVAYPLGRGILVTGMVRYVQLHSALDVALGRSALWGVYAPRGGGLGLVGAF